MTHRSEKTMVVGGGISGIRAALDLARAGQRVMLVEQSDHLGGLLSQLDFQFPTGTCGMCRMLPMMDRDRVSQHCLRRGLDHDRIDVLLNTTVRSVTGEPGQFTVSLKQPSVQVDPGRCIGCGACEAVCPEESPDPFNAGLTRRKAIYRPCPQSFAYAYTIDIQACTRCRACEPVCPTQAIRIQEPDRHRFHVLVVDDETVVRESMKEWLLEEGYQVWCAASAAEALETLETQTCQVMLTDVKMPGMDGVELLRRAKAVQPDLVVVMMTAYAAVDSAVAAMKEGALDYVIKPFEPDTVLEMVAKQFRTVETENARVDTVNSVILAAGCDFFIPESGTNPYGYGRIPGVVSSMAFERMLSHAGPGEGALLHPVTGRPLQRIAWFQCVGSRDPNQGTPRCSTVCCMISLKQALRARSDYPAVTETDIFHMDLRTIGRDGDRFAREARDAGVTCIRARVHSLAPSIREPEGGIRAVWTEMSGERREKRFDLVVLAMGQQPAAGMISLADALDIDRDDQGFVTVDLRHPCRTSRPGIFACGGVTGPCDIQSSVIQASAAAMAALGDPVAIQEHPGEDTQPAVRSEDGAGANVVRTEPRVMVALCRCRDRAGDADESGDLSALRDRLSLDPDVVRAEMTDRLCAPDGVTDLCGRFRDSDANRLVVAACAPLVYPSRIGRVAASAGLPASCVTGVDRMAGGGEPSRGKTASVSVLWRIQAGISRVVHAPVGPVTGRKTYPAALVVGGGLAGMTAALSVADSGYDVVLVEKQAELGGNLVWLRHALENGDTLLTQKIEAVRDHPRIQVHTHTRVADTTGLPGLWETRLMPVTDTDTSDEAGQWVAHGVVVLAVGGTQADPGIPLTDDGPGVYTQQGFQQAMDSGAIDTRVPLQVALIQCWGSRTGSRDYCSQVCCNRALEQAVALTNGHPDTRVIIFYRDMMTPGRMELTYAAARNAGVLFVPYEEGHPPQLTADVTGCRIQWTDPVLDRPMTADLDYAVVAPGVTSGLTRELAGQFGADVDRFGFFAPMDLKWRPVQSVQPRVVGCGLSLIPGSVTQTLTHALAAAVRAVGILSGSTLPADRDVARVRTAWCTVCELCVPACPHEARQVDPLTGKLVVDPLACQGCGICAAVCPSGAAVVTGLTGRPVMDQLQAALSDAM